MQKTIVNTEAAPQAIGTYSQAIKVDNMVFVSGQIALNPSNMSMENGIEAQIHRVIQNLEAVVSKAGGTLNNVIKLNVYLTDLAYYASVNEIMSQYFNPPFPARAVVGVASLPRAALIEMDAIALV